MSSFLVPGHFNCPKTDRAAGCTSFPSSRAVAKILPVFYRVSTAQLGIDKLVGNLLTSLWEWRAEVEVGW